MKLSYLINALEHAETSSGKDLDVLINIEDVGLMSIKYITLDILEQVDGNKLDILVLEPGEEENDYDEDYPEG